MSAEQNKQLVTRFFEDFSAGRFDAALATLADDATWWIAGSFPLSGTKSKKEFTEILAGVSESLPKGIRITPKVLTAEGDRVAVEAESYAEHVNGKVYNNEYHFLIEVRDGKIRSVREYLDTMHANDVLCT